MAGHSIRLDETAAARVLLVRAVETEDRDGLVLTADDRRSASEAAVAGVRGSHGVQARPGAFLARRAEVALERLGGRFPALPSVERGLRWPWWVSLGLPLGALVLGLSTDAFAGERLNIVAFPLLGLIAWNLAVYLLLALRWVARVAGRERAGSGVVGDLLARLVRPASSRLASSPTLERAVVRFTGDWAGAARRLTDARVRRTLHLAAALFAAGVVAAMLIRARYMAEYTATWAGTWAGAEREIAGLLGLVLGPASWLTGIALPDAGQLQQMRGAEQNAGDWLILWAVTAALVVIGPRLVLAALSASKAAVLKRRLPVTEDFYFRSVVRNAVGEPGKARLVAYAVEPGAGGQERLRGLLGSVLGEKVRLSIDSPVPYGEEEAWVAEQGDRLTDSDYLILLFSLSSTPEAENHGAFAEAVARRLRGGATSLSVLLEEGAFRRRQTGLPSGERRVEERLRAWRTVLAGAGVEPTLVSLDEGTEGETAQRLETALLRAGTR